MGAFQKTHSLLARRQTHLPILVIATESAHRMAWKNNLLLTELLEGLAVDWSTSTEQQASIPFRTVNRSVLLHTQNIRVSFGSPSSVQQIGSADEAHELLQRSASLDKPSNTDGANDKGSDKLSRELDLLEDRVDDLLQPSKNDRKNNDPDEEAKRQIFWMDANEEGRITHKEVVEDAFSLTSPPENDWLWRFRMALDHTTNHLSHDLITQPALCLLVCSSIDSNPDESFADLVNPYNLPSQYQNGLWDGDNLRREVLVLHDVQEGPTDVNLDLLQVSLQQQHGPNACVLGINSIHPDTAAQRCTEETTDLWDGQGQKGVCLSVADRLLIRRYIAGIVTGGVLPSMERRIDRLNTVVTERKKGVRNVLRGLWRGGGGVGVGGNSGRDESGSSGTGALGFYRYDSIESQVRLLGDSLFLIQDYEAALSTYKLIKDDYKNDRALIHFASIQEMMALSAYFSDPHGRSREVFQYLEAGLFSYTRAADADNDKAPAGSGKAAAGRPAAASKATRLATRLCLVMSSLKDIMTPDRHLEVADYLASASSNETSLGAAVLLEQSAYNYFQATMYRKFAFHMLMSGHMFRSAQQEHHGFRCFTAALYIYHDGPWDDLHNHLRSALAAQLYSLGRMAVSAQLYSKLIGTKAGGKVSVKSQQKFVHHLMDICREHSGKALIGADRMAAPPGHARQERIDSVDAVLKQQDPPVSRVLELPNMKLPTVLDDTITCTVQAPDVVSALGSVVVNGGDTTVWEAMEIETIAEYKACGGANDFLQHGSGDEDQDIGKSALWGIDDPIIRRVVAEMDKERTNRSLMARAKKAGNVKEQPAVRARQEPLQVSFCVSNPLDIVLELHEIQLVARLTETTTATGASSPRVCTSHDAFVIGQNGTVNHNDPPSGNTDADDKSWTFAGCDKVFFRPIFGRTSTEQGIWTDSANEPFFVVTKETIRLDPGHQSQRVSLGLCPLVQGRLEILGVRCKLLQNGVWVYHPFQVKGPLLQNTQENRANRVRADSMLLHSKIQEDMPRLTAQLVPDDDNDTTGGQMLLQQDKTLSPTVVQGQIRRWKLRLTNIGTAPATRIMLKTNLPWMKLLSQDKDAGRRTNRDSVPCSVGPTATLLNLPIEKLAPSQELDLPVAIRTVGSTQQDFYMLYRYELASDVPTPAKTSSKSHTRWLKQMVDLAIYPSVAFTASLMPSYWQKEEHILSVEVSGFSHRNNLMDRRCRKQTNERTNDAPPPKVQNCPFSHQRVLFCLETHVNRHYS